MGWLGSGGAASSEDPHHGLDRREELLLEVDEVVQGFVRGAEGHVVVAGEAPGLGRLRCGRASRT